VSGATVRSPGGRLHCWPPRLRPSADCDRVRGEEKFRLVQGRAYEIYRHRDSGGGSAEDDWQKAEAEIDMEEALWAELAIYVGHDVENPA
jgi:hypothetical protein